MLDLRALAAGANPHDARSSKAKSCCGSHTRVSGSSTVTSGPVRFMCIPRPSPPRNRQRRQAGYIESRRAHAHFLYRHSGSLRQRLADAANAGSAVHSINMQSKLRHQNPSPSMMTPMRIGFTLPPTCGGEGASRARFTLCPQQLRNAA